MAFEARVPTLPLAIFVILGSLLSLSTLLSSCSEDDESTSGMLLEGLNEIMPLKLLALHTLHTFSHSEHSISVCKLH